MKIPRDLDSKKLVDRLNGFGYHITRQTGSHIRLTTNVKGNHHITIPNHNPLKIGTLNSILLDIAQHHDLTKEDLIRKLFHYKK
jgi:predicted RNA binding protein YcfA (HicA-like mRNA interferase family)